MKPDFASDIRAALALLTRIPVRGRVSTAPGAAWAWPLAGLVPGGGAALVAWSALALGLPPAIAAGLAIAIAAAATGALHEDGLADTVDGLWGGWSVERRLEIMKDSRIGAYGVLALIMGVGLRWASLAALLAAGSVLAPILATALLSRAAMLPVASLLPHARAGGLSAAIGRPSRGAAFAGLALAFGLSILLLGPAALPAAVAAAMAATALARAGRARIGGQTGDLLGATQQLAEIAILVTLTATL